MAVPNAANPDQGLTPAGRARLASPPAFEKKRMPPTRMAMPATFRIVNQSCTCPHQETRAFGSLAQEVMDAGAAGVVAMRYNVFVDTAAQFMAELYGRLAQGDALGEAASFARKQLHDQPLRGIAFDPRPLQDWMVPVVFEAEPVALFPRRAVTGGLTCNCLR